MEVDMKLELIPWGGKGVPNEGVLKQRLADEGFEVMSWRDAPGADYQPHSHDCDESLWVIDGEIVFGIGGHEYPLGPGDRLMLPHGITHTARVGERGATYLIGQRA